MHANPPEIDRVVVVRKERAQVIANNTKITRKKKEGCAPAVIPIFRPDA